MVQELKQGDEILCIKTAKTHGGPHDGKICFKNKKTYKIINHMAQVIDETGVKHGVGVNISDESKWFKEHFVIVNQPNKITFTEEFELSNKAVFVLKVIGKLPNQTVKTSSDYDWLRSQRNYPWELVKKFSERDEEKSLDKAFEELNTAKLLDHPEVGEGCYFRYILNARGKEALNQLRHKDVKQFYRLIPKEWKTGVNKITMD